MRLLTSCAVAAAVTLFAQAVPPSPDRAKAAAVVPIHLCQEGAHGVGLEPNHGPISEWPKRCAEWLAVRGLLTRGSRP